MLRSVTIDKIEEFHCYSFDEGEIYVALTLPHSPILKTFPPQEDFLVADFSGSSSVTVCFTIDVPCKYYQTRTLLQALDRWTQQPFLVGINLAIATHSLYICFVCQVRPRTECLSTEKVLKIGKNVWT